MRSVGSTLCWKASILILVIRNSAAIVWNGDGTDTRWALQCDFIGRDLKNQISRGDQCGSLCKENSPCSHFTWTNYNGGTCWMKSGYVSEFDAVSKTNDGAVCGFLKTTVSPPASAWKDEGTLKWALNCDFLGRDLMAVATAAEKCGGTCLSNPECSHFTWTNYQGGTCWLKKNGASDCDAVVKSDSGAVCGFLKF
ncbi:hypothetical protein DAPPUDRAFT_227578 [Daphnia pulex]|uniref:Apple domain-containing protein n=1 Tax=Daphnia pulex TaxID=6669 RepID=E9H7J5_DAPPU|nr:hypothetical protein DAPPUDRAFT_227578 [Daphnia pulex]|eukprot:EFX72198.1 hypothetical protein DAPPUDRAFT_227578 [Daphnia pulex]